MTFYLKYKVVTVETKLRFVRTAATNPFMKHGTRRIYKGSTLSDIPPGDAVHAIAYIEEIGGKGGEVTIQIYNKTDSKYEGSGSTITWVPANSAGIQKSCSMTMPSKNVDIELYVIWEKSATERYIVDTEGC